MSALWITLAAGALAGLASAPHCFAMCGPLALFAVTGGARGSTPWRVARYQLGRLLSYVTLGAIAGSSGGAITAALPPRATAVALSLVVAGAMLFAALRLVRPARRATLVPLRRTRGRPPLASRLLACAPREPAWIGAVSALLPCGTLYAAVLIAAGSGTGSAGAAAMGAFAITSGLGLLASAALGERARASLFGRRVLAGVLVVGALVALMRPLLAGDGAHCHPRPEETSEMCGARPAGRLEPTGAAITR